MDYFFFPDWPMPDPEINLLDVDAVGVFEVEPYDVNQVEVIAIAMPCDFCLIESRDNNE